MAALTASVMAPLTPAKRAISPIGNLATNLALQQEADSRLSSSTTIISRSSPRSSTSTSDTSAPSISLFPQGFSYTHDQLPTWIEKHHDYGRQARQLLATEGQTAMEDYVTRLLWERVANEQQDQKNAKRRKVLVAKVKGVPKVPQKVGRRLRAWYLGQCHEFRKSVVGIKLANAWLRWHWSDGDEWEWD